MAHFKIQPPGVFNLDACDRKHIVRVTSGDTWSVSLNLYHPINTDEPAYPSNTFVEVTLSETQFDDPLWTGGWYTGVKQDDRRKDLVHVTVPRSITKKLRRGSYLFSIRVSDLLKTRFVTEAEGSFLVEYAPTSEQHSIPYKDKETEESSQSSVTPVTPVYDDAEDFKYHVTGEAN